MNPFVDENNNLIVPREYISGPIVYLVYDENECIYVGKSKHGMQRLGEKRHSALRLYTHIEIEPRDSDEDAKQRERILIRSFRPKLNTRMNERVIPDWFSKLEKNRSVSSQNLNIAKLYYQQGLVESEIANLENITISSVHSRLRSIKRILTGLQACSATKKRGENPKGRPKKTWEKTHSFAE